MTICGAESFRWPVPASLSSVSVSVWRETTVDFVEDLLTGRELRALELKMGCVHIPKTALVGIFTKTTSTCPKFQLQHLQHLSLVDSTTGYITGKVISLIGKLERLQTLELENVYFPSDEKWDLSSLKNLHYVYVGTSPAGNDMVFCEFIASLFCIELQLTTTNFLPLELCETVQTFMWTITNPTVGRPYSESLLQMRHLTTFYMDGINIYDSRPSWYEEETSQRIQILVLEVDSKTKLESVFKMSQLRSLTLTAKNTYDVDHEQAQYNYVNWRLRHGYQSSTSTLIMDVRLLKAVRTTVYKESQLEVLVLHKFLFFEVKKRDLEILFRDAVPKLKQLTLKQCYFQQEQQ